jgi:hypothetical protein
MIAIEQTLTVTSDRHVTITVPETVEPGDVKTILIFPNAVPAKMDATEYLYSNPANRKVMVERAADIEAGKNLVSFPAEQFRL